jgi:hypothetical protein
MVGRVSHGRLSAHQKHPPHKPKGFDPFEYRPAVDIDRHIRPDMVSAPTTDTDFFIRTG